MKYYKIIKDNAIVGVVSSINFIAYQPVTQCFLCSTEDKGEYVNYNGQLYRDKWMQPIQWRTDFISAELHEITEEEYHIYADAIEIEGIVYPEQEEEEEEPYVSPIDIASVEFVRHAKLKELDLACRANIEKGFDLGTKHYSMSKEDQINLLQAQISLNNEEPVMYHADGEDYRFFNEEELRQVIEKATNWRLQNVVYLKNLKKQVNAAETIEEIAAITYER